MSDTPQFEGLTVSIRKTEAGDAYVAYVSPNGVDFPIGSATAGGFEQDLQEVQAAQDATDLQAAREAQAGGSQ